MNRDLVQAIADKRLIEFIYRIGQIRVVEPHDYGVRHGVERLLGFQISGASRSGAPQDGRSSTSMKSSACACWKLASSEHGPTVRNVIEDGTHSTRASV